MLTLHGMMREEFGEGHDVRRAATEASTEMALPDRAVAIADPDGKFAGHLGARHAVAAVAIDRTDRRASGPVHLASERYRVMTERVDVPGKRYVAAIAAPLASLDADDAALRTALGWGIFVAMLAAGARRMAGGPRKRCGRSATWLGRPRRSPSATPVGRLSAPHPGDELGTLAAAFNGCSIGSPPSSTRSVSSWRTRRTNCARRSRSSARRRRSPWRATSGRRTNTANR